MKRYISHKIVEAAQIVLIGPSLQYPDGHSLGLDDQTTAHYDGSMFVRYKPVVGDYLVRYTDGYESISPKQAFEEGYTLYQPRDPAQT